MLSKCTGSICRLGCLVGKISEAKGIKDSKPTIYRKIKAGRFPRPIYPGKSPAWVEHEVDAHLLSLIARRDAGGAE